MTDVHVLPIRHHGPGSARSVAEALDELAPDVVLIEGPPELGALTGLVGHPELIPPVAALVYEAVDPRHASFFPLAAFSPEWVALTWARGHGARVGMLDLPAAHDAGLRAATLARVGHETGPQPADGDPGPSPGAEPRRDPIAALAAVAGYDDPERWWEDAVEQRRAPVLERFAAITEAVAALRDAEGASDAFRDGSGGLDLDALADPVGAPRTALREAAMRRILRAELKAGPERIVVVCGAWHAPALLPERFPPASADNARLRGLPKAKVTAAWVPWTSRRLSQRSGYGAGVTAPGWYAHLFAHSGDADAADPAHSWLVGVARALREQGLSASPASVVDAARLAQALASLRGRPGAGLSELEDAALAVLADGNPSVMATVRDALLLGDELGRVPPDAPLVPLAADVARCQRATRLKPTATTTEVTLDLRTPNGLARSVMLHRLSMLGIAWGTPIAVGQTTGTFKEAWSLTWEPELSVRLVEASVHGSTLEQAAGARAEERARSAAELSELSELLGDCLVADLPVGAIVSELARRAAVSADVSDLLGMVGPLARLCRYGSVRGAAGERVLEVLRASTIRACLGLPLAVTGLDEEAARTLLRRVDSAHAGLALLVDDDLLDRWYAALDTIARRDHVAGLLAGRATRLLLDSGRLERSEAARRLGLWLSPAVPTHEAAGWLDGFLAGDATLLIHDPGLLALIDGWLGAIPLPDFRGLLPLIRRTFSAFTPAERRMIGEQISQGSRTTDAVPYDLDAAGPALAAVASLLGWGKPT